MHSPLPLLGNAAITVAAPRRAAKKIPHFPDEHSESASATTTTPIDLAELAQRRMKYDPKCFGCRCGFKRPDNAEDDPRMYELFELFIQNKYKIGDGNLFKEMEKLQYELYVREREHMPDFRADMERWTAEQIKTHVTEHVVFYELETHDLYNDLRDCRNLLKRCTFAEEDATEKVVVDEKNYRLYLETIKLQKQLLESLVAGKKTS